MGLFSIFGKNKQESAAQDSGRFSRDDDDFAERARAKRASHSNHANESGQGGSRRSRSGGDPMLPEKKRARRRLVGAVALALAAAVGVMRGPLGTGTLADRLVLGADKTATVFGGRRSCGRRPGTVLLVFT